MKKIIFVFAFIGTISTFGLTSCSTLNSTLTTMGTSNLGTNTGTVTPSSAGKSLGGAISSLYVQYKQSGTIQLSNMNNLLLMQQLVSNANIYRKNYKDSAFLSSFALGLVSGSNNLINQSNQSSVLSNILKIASSGATKDISSVTKAASSVNTLMALLSK